MESETYGDCCDPPQTLAREDGNRMTCFSRRFHPCGYLLLPLHARLFSSILKRRLLKPSSAGVTESGLTKTR